MMRTWVAALLTMTMCAGCATVPNGEAVCDRTRAARAAHAAALVVDGGPESRASGRALIALIDAGCGK